jgi:hypothetical protein
MFRSSLRLAVAGAGLMGAVACGGGSGPTPPTPASTTPTAPPTPAVMPGAPLNRNGVFDAAVVVDAQAPQTAQADVTRVIARAAAKLFEKTGEGLRLSEVVYGMARGPGVSDLARRYATTAAANPPDGVMVLSDDTSARTFGGYSTYFVPPFPFANEYASPRAGVAGANLYVAVVHFDHPYARCGYDDQGNRVSDVSVGGECRNRPGTACVQRGDRWMCADALADLYADPDYFTACTMVHEFLHPFGIDANPNLDHYGTQECRQRTGMSAQQAGDTREFQLNCGMCPDVYPRFRRGS